jgi:hypothetical protein
MTAQRLLRVAALAPLASFFFLACVGPSDTGGFDTEDGAAQRDGCELAEIEAIGEGAQEDNRDLPAVTLPYASTLHIQHDIYSRPFQLAHHASVTVVGQARWTFPGQCRASYTVELYEANTRKSRGALVFRSDGKEDAKSWPGLEPGKYYFLFRTTNHGVQRCWLDGKITIRVT